MQLNTTYISQSEVSEAESGSRDLRSSGQHQHLAIFEEAKAIYRQLFYFCSNETYALYHVCLVKLRNSCSQVLFSSFSKRSFSVRAGHQPMATSRPQDGGLSVVKPLSHWKFSRSDFPGTEEEKVRPWPKNPLLVKSNAFVGCSPVPPVRFQTLNLFLKFSASNFL